MLVNENCTKAENATVCKWSMQEVIKPCVQTVHTDKVLHLKWNGHSAENGAFFFPSSQLNLSIGMRKNLSIYRRTFSNKGFSINGFGVCLGLLCLTKSFFFVRFNSILHVCTNWRGTIHYCVLTIKRRISSILLRHNLWHDDSSN